jgi:hypothetical protein
MGLFGKKSNGGKRCPECRFYAMVEGHGYCGKAVAATTDIRKLSAEGLKRQCVRCPSEMTCDAWQAK